MGVPQSTINYQLLQDSMTFIAIQLSHLCFMHPVGTTSFFLLW